MFSFNTTCCFAVCFLSLSLSATADTLRGVSTRRLEKEPAVNLLEAGNYAILTKTGISTVPDSAITGNIAVSPIAATAMTGFSLTLDAVGTFSTSTQVTGNAFAASYLGTTPTVLTTAVSNMETAYTDAAGRVNPDGARINLGAGLLGGAFGGASNKLTPGVYTFGSDVSISDNIYFQGTGTGVGQGDTDIFIIQIAGNLKQAANTQVILENGALAKNIFWQVATYVEVGKGAQMEGIILAKTFVDFLTGSSLDGRVLSQTACNLQVARITQPAGN
jgi:hypothetical protein